MAFPKIHFGVYKIPAGETAKAVENALEVGYRGVDSARAYQNEREAVAGIYQFLEKHPEVKRSDVFYTTKVASADYGYEKAKTAIQESLERAANIGYIDLFLIHSSHGGPSVRSETWRALEEAKKSGHVKHIGVSNWGVKHLEQLALANQETPFANQIELNPWLQHGDIVDYCKKHNIIVEAWSPLTRGLRLDDPELAALSKKYGKSPAQILICWAYQYGTIPIPKTTSRERQIENLQALDFELSPEDFANLGSKEDYYVTSPAWDPTVLE